MTRARRELIDLEATPYYHCICRCVRRAFLCGEDQLTGKNYEHRKHWVVERLAELSRVFAIEVCAYAVMSNHYHVVLRVDHEKVRGFTDDQVIRRWKRLFSLPLLVERYQTGESGVAESREAKKIIALWRTRLMDLSWYMRGLNEYLARKANEEDQCKGRFWEGRYKSQALLDEAAVLTGMSYVDLNPIRAGIATTPEDSDFTSIQQRIEHWQTRQRRQRRSRKSTPKATPQVALMALVKQRQDPHPQALGFTARDYLELVDWAGRAIREDKRGAIPEHIPPILQRLKLNPESYLRHMQGRRASLRHHPRALGSIENLKKLAKQLGQKFIRGQGQSLALYRQTA